MRPARRHLVVLIGLALSGCGSSDEKPKGKELPRAAVADLQTRLDEVERRYRAAIDDGKVGACDDIHDDSFPGGEDKGIDQILAELPDDVDPGLRKAVEESFANLRTLTEEGCADVRPPPRPETEPELEPEQSVPEEAPIPEVTPLEEPKPKETPPEEETVPQIEDGGGAVSPDGGGTPPGQGGTPPNGNGGGAQAPQGLERD